MIIPIDQVQKELDILLTPRNVGAKNIHQTLGTEIKKFNKNTKLQLPDIIIRNLDVFTKVFYYNFLMKMGDGGGSSGPTGTYVKNVTYEDTTGILTFTFNDGTIYQINIAFSELLKGLDFDNNTDELVITKEDGSEIRVSLVDLIDVYVGSIGSNIQITIGSGNTINATLLNNSITLAQLAPAVRAMLDDPLTRDIINVKKNLRVYNDDIPPPVWENELIGAATIGQLVDNIDFQPNGVYTPEDNVGNPVADASNTGGIAQMILVGETTGIQIYIERTGIGYHGSPMAMIRIRVEGAPQKAIWVNGPGWVSTQTQFSVLELIGEPTARVTQVLTDVGYEPIMSQIPLFKANVMLEYNSAVSEAISDIQTANVEHLVVNAANGTSFFPTRPLGDSSNEGANTSFVHRAVDASNLFQWKKVWENDSFSFYSPILDTGIQIEDATEYKIIISALSGVTAASASVSNFLVPKFIRVAGNQTMEDICEITPQATPTATLNAIYGFRGQVHARESDGASVTSLFPSFANSYGTIFYTSSSGIAIDNASVTWLDSVNPIFNGLRHIDASGLIFNIGLGTFSGVGTPINNTIRYLVKIYKLKM